MLSEVFYWFLNMSISGTVTACAVLLLSKLKRLPRRLCYSLWAVPLIRFWLPIAPTGKYSLIELVLHFLPQAVILSDSSYETAAINYIALANSYHPFHYRDMLLKQIFNIAAVIWICVTVLIITFITINYIFTKRMLKNGEYFSKNICFADGITSPAVYGVISPTIVIPSKFREQDNTFILMHENVHIKRCDNLWRIIAFVTAAFHWFNPLIWLFVKSFLNEMELSCDEKVLSQLKNDERRVYALTLIESAEINLKLASTFTGGKLRRRVEYILAWKKMSVFSMLCLVGFSTVIIYVLVTNPV